MASARAAAHTLIFNLVIVGIGWFLYRWRTPGFLYMALASCGHLVLDRMWQMPAILLWPLLGAHFPPVGLPGIAQLHEWWRQLFADPWVWVPELVGAAIWVGFAARLTRLRGWGRFIYRGVIP